MVREEGVRGRMVVARDVLRAHPVGADAALAAGFAAAALVSVISLFAEIEHVDPTFHRPAAAAYVGSMLLVSLPLAWRRRFPCAVAVVVVVGFLVGRIVVEVPEAAITLLAGSLALYSVAVHARARWRNVVLALCLGAIMGEVVRELFFTGPDDLHLLYQGFVLAYNAVVLALPWALGSVIRSLREREHELADRAAELQREREENARQAVFAERVRIARELHDVVAHHVSVMGIQAGAARRVMERRPDQATEALASIEASSRQAVSELHRLLGFLRRAGETDEIAPQPRFDELADLVAQSAQGDLAVDLEIEGEPVPLAPTLQVSAYRVIQEALTNARKHSDGHRATVRVAYSDAALDVEVVDDGPARSRRGGAAPAGHGLIGMRERAALHGGHLSAGPRPGGGFAVHASFPLDGGPS